MAGRLAALLLSLTLPCAGWAQGPSGGAHAAAPAKVHGRASGLAGPVVLKLGTTMLTVAADGAFAFPAPLRRGTRYHVEVVSAPSGAACRVTPAKGVAGAAVELVLSCVADGAPSARPLLPAENAANVSPLIGKVVLLVSAPLVEPPTGALLLETLDGEDWVDTGLEASAEYLAETREWRFVLAARAFPANRRLRATVVPAGGKTADGKTLARTPIRWSFTTGPNPLLQPRSGDPRGGCPVTDAAKPAQPAGEPCDEPGR